MHANQFWWVGPSGFAPFQIWPNFTFGPWTMHGGQKIKLAQKFMQVEVDPKCTHGEYGLSSFVFGQIFFSDHEL